MWRGNSSWNDSGSAFEEELKTHYIIYKVWHVWAYPQHYHLISFIDEAHHEKKCLSTFHHKYKSFKTLSDILHFPGNSKIFSNWQDGYTDRHGGKLARCVCYISFLIRRAYQISSSNKSDIRHLVSCHSVHIH